jgi:hypothetical protein
MIEKFCVFGERCSGTTYLEELLKHNFELQQTDEFGDKHLFKLKGFDNSDTTLFIGIERELISWMDSFSKTPHQVRPYSPLDYEQLFFQPITSTYEDITETDPNIMECRMRKSNLIRKVFPRRVKNFYFITYEDLKADPIVFLQLIHKWFDLPTKPHFPQNWIYYKSEETKLFKERPVIIPPKIIEQLKQTYPKHFIKVDEN